MIVATAGHVDHGKTALVKALTGTDTDRLPEEKARGLSIDLGFAYLSLPDAGKLGFVDVPGHKKFIRNMLAGVVGIDLGLLVVAADDGVMPQTREHLAILGLLGIEQCLVALTKIDRVPRDRVLAVHAQVDRLLNDAGRADHPVFPVCALRGVGVEALRDALGWRAKAERKRPVDGYFRMAIDRAFNLKGVGLVVTGVVFSGVASISESLMLSSDGLPVRVRRIRVHDQFSNQAKVGERCALNIVGRGVNEQSIRRGTWLMHSDLYNPTRRIDVELQVLKTETKSLKHWLPTHLHIGSDHLSTRVAVLSGRSIAAGTSGLAQLVLPRDIVAVHGDRFVLRDHSAQRTLAGGRVIDPFPPKRGRARPSRLVTLSAMRGETPIEILRALAKKSETGVPLWPFSVSHNLPAAQIDALIISLGLRRVGTSLQERAFCELNWRKLLDRVVTEIANFHHSRPTYFGASVKDIQALLVPFVETATLNAILRILVRENRLGARGHRFHLPSHHVHVAAQDLSLLGRAAPVLAPKSGAPPSLYQAAKEIGVDANVLEKTLKIGVRVGEIVVVGKNRYVPKAVISKLEASVEQLASRSTGGLFTTIEYRDEVNMGRNFAIAVLEYFDRIGLTIRVGDYRRLRRCAAGVLSVEKEQ